MVIFIIAQRRTAVLALLQNTRRPIVLDTTLCVAFLNLFF